MGNKIGVIFTFFIIIRGIISLECKDVKSCSECAPLYQIADDAYQHWIAEEEFDTPFNETLYPICTWCVTDIVDGALEGKCVLPEDTDDCLDHAYVCPEKQCSDYENCDDCNFFESQNCGWCGSTETCMSNNEAPKCKDCYKTQFKTYAEEELCPYRLCSQLNKTECTNSCKWCHVSKTCHEVPDKNGTFCDHESCLFEDAMTKSLAFLDSCDILFVPYIIELLTIVMGNVSAVLISFSLIFYCKPGNCATFLIQGMSVALDLLSFYAFMVPFYGTNSLCRDAEFSDWECYQCVGLMLFNSRIYATLISLVTTRIGISLALRQYKKDDSKLEHLNSRDKTKAIEMLKTRFSGPSGEKGPESWSTKKIQDFIFYRCVLCCLLLPYFFTHFIPGIFLGVWPIVFIVLICIGIYLFKTRFMIEHYKSKVETKVAIAIFLFICVPVIMMAFHSVFQYSVIYFSGVPWNEMFALEYTLRNFHAYLESKIASLEHMLYLLHIVL